MKKRVTELGPRRWAKQDEELERYWRTPWLRYRGNLGDGNHRTRLPTMGEQEQGWGMESLAARSWPR